MSPERFSEIEIRNQVEADCHDACETIEHLLRELQKLPDSSFAREIIIHGAVATVSTMVIGLRELLFALLSTGTSVAVLQGKKYLNRTDSGLTRPKIEKAIHQAQDIILECGKIRFDTAVSACAPYKIDLYRDHNAIEVSIKRLMETLSTVE